MEVKLPEKEVKSYIHKFDRGFYSFKLAVFFRLLCRFVGFFSVLEISFIV